MERHTTEGTCLQFKLQFKDDITSFGAEGTKPVPHVPHVEQDAFASSGAFERDSRRRE